MRPVLSSRSIVLSAAFLSLGMMASPASWLGRPGRDQLTRLLQHVRVVDVVNAQNGETTTVIRFSGVNVQIVNGLGATNGTPADPSAIEPTETAVNGLGNLIVGYNEGADNFDRAGSHNIIAGTRHQYSSFGGLVVGSNNTISGVFSAVSGGYFNVASGRWSSVSAGWFNSAGGDSSSVSGGTRNVASGDSTSVSGGESNAAAAFRSTVNGGANNTAGGQWSTVSGGGSNQVVSGGSLGTISGGFGNTASGLYSTVGGGCNVSVNATCEYQ